MNKPLTGMNIAILAASGCKENQVLSSQKSMLAV